MGSIVKKKVGEEMSDQKIKVRIESEAQKAKREVEELKDSVQSLYSSVTMMIEKTTEIEKTLIGLTDYTDDYISSMRLLGTVFDDNIDRVSGFVEEMSSMTGLRESTLTRQIALFGQVGKSINLDTQYTEKLAKGMTNLSAKMAILYNQDYEVVALSLQRAIQGTQETLKAMTGIEANEASEAALLLSYGIDREVSSLNEAEQAIVRYATIVQQVSNQNELYERIVNSLTWQKQMLSNQVSRLAEALGSVLYPILNKVLPVLNGIAMAITEIISLFAKLVGFNFEVATSTGGIAGGFDDITQSANNAGKSVKKQLRSFDKLNNITTPSAGSASGGGGLGIDNSILGLLDKVDDGMLDIKNKAEDIRDSVMEWLGFTKIIDENGNLIGWKYEGIETTIRNIVDWWKQLNTVGKIFAGLGLALVFYNIWRMAKKLSDILGVTGLIKIFKNLASVIIGKVKSAFSKFSGYIQTATSHFSTFQNIILGLVMVGGGLYLMYNMMEDINTNGLTLKNVIGLISGAVMTFTGAVWLANAALQAFNISTGGIATIIGLGVTGIAGLVSWLTTQKDKTVEVTSATEEFNNKLKELEETAQQNIASTLAQASRAEELKNKLLELVDSNGQVIGSQEEARVTISALNELLGTEYELTGNQITLNGEKINTYKQLADSVENYCAKLRAEAYVEAYREEYIERLKRQKEVQQQIEEMTNRLTNAQKNYDMTSQEGVLKFISDHEDVFRQLADLQGQYDTNSQELENYEKAAYEASVGNYEEAERLLTETLAKVGVSTEDMINKIIGTTDRIPEEVRDSVKEIESMKPTMNVKVKLDTSRVNGDLTSLRNSMAKKGITIDGFASGGFPSTGEMFMARENGAPELVGKIGKRTAVANNDQIISGIQSGVYQAMMSALSVVDFGSNVTIEASGDDDGLLNFISFKQKQKDRQYAN